MRILHLLNDVSNVGNGVVNAAVDLACQQAQDGHEVRVASSGGEYEALLADHSVKHLPLDGMKDLWRLPLTTARCWAIMKAFRPHVVHTHTRPGTVIAGLLRRLRGYALITTVHNTHRRGPQLLRLSDRVVAVSEAVASYARAQGVKASRVRVVLNGTLDSARTGPISEVQPADLMPPAIVTVAGMYHRKGIADLISAFGNLAPRLPEAHLYLVGDGHHRAEFEELARKSPATHRISFEGFQKEPRRYMLAADVFVLASHQEPCALVLSEAREAGCAIVSSDVGGTREALDGGAAGVLVPPKDATAMADALFRVLADPEERTMWRERASQGLERFSVRRVAREYEVVYEDVLKAGTRV